MLTVDEYDLIRRKHRVDGMSLRAISRELGYARNTVAKAVTSPIPPGYRLSKPRPKPAIDPVKHIIDAWLEQDKGQRPKQRHTGQRIYERLRDDHNFKGSPAAVRRYIREARQRSQEPPGYEPDEFRTRPDSGGKRRRGPQRLRSPGAAIYPAGVNAPPGRSQACGARGLWARPVWCQTTDADPTTSGLEIYLTCPICMLSS